MSREIKFRVWDQKHKQLTSPLNACKRIGYSNFDIDIEGRITREILNLGVKDGKLTDGMDRSTTENQDNYIIQQFTGFSDHKSKEIYEGDIIDLTYSKGHERDSSYDYYGRYVVEFKNGSWILIPQNLYDSDDEQRDLELYLESSDYVKSKGMRRFEVIGNIFENPDLIK